jgi:L-alanine-DL-glutamate epimerase-like enolase superfamily enzyme
MKIAAIEGFRLYPIAIKEAWVEDAYVWPRHPPSVLVKVTAEDGAYGIGEASSQEWYLGESSEQLETQIARYDTALKGRDPGNFALCHHLMEAAYGGGMPGARAARSGVDMALYDLVGKARGLPVHALLGGAYRNTLSMLTNLYHKTPDAMADACRDYVSRGFKGLKIKVGDVLLADGWSRDGLISELAKLDAAVAATPRDVMIDADANQGWESAAWTVQSLRRYAGCDNLSIEQPLPYADLDGHVHVRRAAGVPVILDESVWSAKQMLQIARMQACDRIVLKLNRLGGFFESMKAVAICESANIGVSVDTNPYTLIGDTACCHIAAAIHTHYPVDCEGHMSFLDLGPHKFITGGITIKAGNAYLPDAAGLGIDIDWTSLAKHREAAYSR